MSGTFAVACRQLKQIALEVMHECILGPLLLIAAAFDLAVLTTHDLQRSWFSVDSQ